MCVLGHGLCAPHDMGDLDRRPTDGSGGACYGLYGFVGRLFYPLKQALQLKACIAVSYGHLFVEGTFD